jgi:hypothetical protein
LVVDIASLPRARLARCSSAGSRGESCHESLAISLERNRQSAPPSSRVGCDTESVFALKGVSVVDVTITEGIAHFRVQGWDQLWSLKSELAIPLAHIRNARADPTVARGWWHGIKAPGTNLPGVITAGTFYQHGKRIFWDVHDPENTIVIELSDERYDDLIVEVADPAAVVQKLRSAKRV